MATEREASRRKHEELAQAYREKTRKLLQTQELYDKVKRKFEMGHLQRAASDAVDSTVHNATHQMAHGVDGSVHNRDSDYQQQAPSFPQGPRYGSLGTIKSGPPLGNTSHPTDETRWVRPGGPHQSRAATTHQKLLANHIKLL